MYTDWVFCIENICIYIFFEWGIDYFYYCNVWRENILHIEYTWRIKLMKLDWITAI